MRHRNLSLHRFSRRFKGGGGGSLPPPAPSAPAPTTTKLEVTQAERDTRRKSKKRRGMSYTIMAGENKPTEKSTLLGGGYE